MEDNTNMNKPFRPMEGLSESPPESLEEAARRRLREDVDQSKTISEAKTKLTRARDEFEENDKEGSGAAVLRQAEDNLGEAEGRGSSFLLRADLPGGAGVQGQSRLSSGQAELRKSALYELDTEEGGDRVARLIAHESEHAFNQNPDGIGAIGDPGSGKVIEGETSIEGLTVTKTDPTGIDDVPYETYGEGVDFVANAGQNTVEKYVEKGSQAGDTVAYQAEVIRNYDTDMDTSRIQSLASKAGFTEEEQKELFEELGQDLPEEMQDENAEQQNQ